MFLGVLYNNQKYPILEILEKEEQLVIRIIGTSIHWTLHKPKILYQGKDITKIIKDREAIEIKNNFYPDLFIFNSSDDKNLTSNWSEEKISIAKRKNFENPRRHGHYIINELLKPIKNIRGYSLGKIPFDLRNLNKKYLNKKIKIMKEVKHLDFSLEIILSTKNNPYQSNDFFVGTGFGKLFFKFDIYTSKIDYKKYF